MSDAQAEARELGGILADTQALGRRAFLKRLSAASAGSVFLSSLHALLSGPAGAADLKPITILGWGGPWKDAVVKSYNTPFTKLSGIPVNYVSPYDYSKIKLMDRAHQQKVDLITTTGLDTLRTIRDGLTTPLDFAIIDRSALSPGQLRFKNTVGGCAVGTVMVYNKERWPGDQHPKSWADFWDLKRFPGPRGLDRLPYPTLEFALLADGVPKEKLYPLDLDRGFRKLDQIKSSVPMWFVTGSEPQQMVQNREIDLTAMWTSRANDSIVNKKVPYEIVWDGGASEGTVESWSVLRNSPNPEGAMKFINFAGSAEAQAAFARILFAAPTNLNAYRLLDRDTAARLPTYPPNEQRMFFVDFDYWMANIDQVTLRFENWLQA
jgi:putative spermidine/putrescine transport system substrate-binding protein